MSKVNWLLSALTSSTISDYDATFNMEPIKSASQLIAQLANGNGDNGEDDVCIFSQDTL